MKKHKEKLDENKIRLTAFVSLLMGFVQAVLTFIISTYFKINSSTENVGIFYAISYIIFLFILLNLHKIIKIFGKANVFYFSLITKIIVVSLLIPSTLPNLGIFLLMTYIILASLEWVILDIIVEGFSIDQFSGRIRGSHLTIINAGFLFGPFVSTYILERIGFNGVFIFSFVFNIFVFIFSLIAFRNVNHRFKYEIKTLDLIKKVVNRKNVLRIYYISFVLDFFYALMTIYTPIYLRDLGYSWENIGLIFTIMLIPFVIVQYPAGILADKKIGEKELLFLSLFLMSISTFALYFISKSTLIIWATMLFMTRIGASLVEVLRDSYFYKRVDGFDVDIISFFKTSLPVAYIAATILSSFIFIFLPIKFAFILTGLIILTALKSIIYLKDNKSEKEMKISC